MTQQITTIRLPGELRRRLDSLALATGRSMTHHIQRAVEEYVERQSWQTSQIHAALAQARAGQGDTMDEYVERSIAQGTLTREGYERALADEVARARADSA